MSKQTYDTIIERLDAHGCEYTTSEHEPTRTSEDAARVRGVEMKTGAKAIVVKGSKTKTYTLCVMPANLRLDSKAIKEILGEKVSFASDVESVTGCVPGSVPPFGSVLGLKTYVDPRLSENETINFNAGELTRSIGMRYEDYLAVEQPTVRLIAKEA